MELAAEHNDDNDNDDRSDAPTDYSNHPKISYRKFLLSLFIRQAKRDNYHHIDPCALYDHPGYKDVTLTQLEQERIAAISTSFYICHGCGGWGSFNHNFREEIWRPLPKKVLIAIGRITDQHIYPEGKWYVSNHGRLVIWNNVDDNGPGFPQLSDRMPGLYEFYFRDTLTVKEYKPPGLSGGSGSQAY